MRNAVPLDGTKHRNAATTTVESLTRGLEVLEAFTSATPRLTLSEIADKTHLPKSTTHRYLHTLKLRGYVAQDPGQGSYLLGLRALELGSAAVHGLEFPVLASPYLEDLAHATQEAASMAVLDGATVVFVSRSATRRWMSTRIEIGSRLPAHCTSLGKVLLAALDDRMLEVLLSQMTLNAYTCNTITDRDLLVQELSRVRRAGYALDNEELELGLRAAAAPIRSRDGRVVAAVNISMAASRVTMDELKGKFIPLLLASAEGISAAYGGTASQPAGDTSS